MTYYVVYSDPECGRSRDALGKIRTPGIEPHLVEYPRTPPARTLLVALIERMGVPVRSVLREEGTPFYQRGLFSASLTTIGCSTPSRNVPP